MKICLVDKVVDCYGKKQFIWLIKDVVMIVPNPQQDLRVNSPMQIIKTSKGNRQNG